MSKKLRKIQMKSICVFVKAVETKSTGNDQKVYTNYRLDDKKKQEHRVFSFIFNNVKSQ